MKFCQPHWEQTRQAIKSRGLYDLVAKDGKEAMEQMLGELKGEKKTLENFDPLMAVHNMITSRAIECGGLYLMTMKPDGTHYCPLCELKDKAGLDPAVWINGASDAAAKMAKELAP